MLTVLIMIGNSDDKLKQHQWASFYHIVDEVVFDYADIIHGAWASLSDSAFQNAAWCVELYEDMASELKHRLGVIAGTFEQDSIAWAEIPQTQFLKPARRATTPQADSVAAGQQAQRDFEAGLTCKGTVPD